MDTNLKKGKKIRAFCYRLLAAGALAVTLISGIVGRDAIEVFLSEGSSALSGDFYEMPEFKDYIGELCYQAMLISAGVGDYTGSPLSGQFSYAARAYADAKTFFKSNIQKARGHVLYFMQFPDGTVDTNMSYAVFSEFGEYMVLPEGTVLCYLWNGPDARIGSGLYNGITYVDAYCSSMPYQPLNDELSQTRLVIAVEADRILVSPFLSGLQAQAQNYRLVLIIFFTGGIITVLSILLCLFSRRAFQEGSRSYAAFAGKLLLEFKLVPLLLLLLLPLYHTFPSGPPASLSYTECLWRILPALPAGILLFLFYTDIRHNKSRFFVCSIPGKLILYVKEFLDSVPWYRKVMYSSTVLLAGTVTTIAAGIFLLVTNLSDLYETMQHRYLQPFALDMITHNIYVLFFVIGLLFTLSIFLFTAYLRTRKLTKDIKSVSDKLAGLKNGFKTAPLVLPKGSLLRQTAEDVNSLEDGIEKMAEQKNRSNKLRVELLTNVSHDLKTPLTSIINYADLLCEEELNENAAGYAASLRTKAYRLKSMVQDVFELSKATSGNLPVDKQTLDLVKLVRQTLADMEERIQESSLTFKTIISEEPILIEADGEKLYRVFQNLFVNALQYSLENSRVYVMLSVEEGKACAKVKNTSKWEIDFKPDDIMERFVRADASRTTEGSGLGLSIVQSFAEVCGGSFSIETDADMFTACLRFPLTEKTAPDSADKDEEVTA